MNAINRLICAAAMMLTLCVWPTARDTEPAPHNGDGILRVVGVHFTDRAYDFVSEDDRAAIEALIARCMQTPAGEDEILQTMMGNFQMPLTFVRMENGREVTYVFLNNPPLLAVSVQDGERKTQDSYYSLTMEEYMRAEALYAANGGEQDAKDYRDLLYSK
ncbi:MAG: hypothetical protein FWF69_02700 [Firmicutes bacterium]|nr:hypothetical protein [Bacillota bacterium]